VSARELWHHDDFLFEEHMKEKEMMDAARKVSCDELVADLRKSAPGRVTTVSYEGLKFALACGIDVWEYAETYTLQRLIADIGTPEQKIRLQQALTAGRRATQIWLRENPAAEMDLARRIAEHKAPGIHLTTEQLGEALLQDVKKMSPDKKAELRRRLNYSVLTKTEKRRVN
jgi:hypothetical protein